MEELKQLLDEKNIDDFAFEITEKIVNENSDKATESDKKNRTKILQFRVTEDELKRIDERMQKSYSKSRGDFLRRCALSPVNIIINEEKIDKQNRLISGIANNINQIAVRLNSTGRIYKEDIKELQEEAEQIWQLQVSILSELHSINQFSTSLTEIKPETASLLLAAVAYQMYSRQQSSLCVSEPVEQEEVPF